MMGRRYPTSRSNSATRNTPNEDAKETDTPPQDRKELQAIFLKQRNEERRQRDELLQIALEDLADLCAAIRDQIKKG